MLFTDVLHFVQTELNHAALAFSVGICLTLYSRTTAFAGYDLMFAHAATKIHAFHGIRFAALL